MHVVCHFCVPGWKLFLKISPCLLSYLIFDMFTHCLKGQVCIFRSKKIFPLDYSWMAVIHKVKQSFLTCSSLPWSLVTLTICWCFVFRKQKSGEHKTYLSCNKLPIFFPVSQENWSYKSSTWRDFSFAEFLRSKQLQAGTKSITVDGYNREWSMTAVPGNCEGQLIAGHSYVTGFRQNSPVISGVKNCWDNMAWKLLIFYFTLMPLSRATKLKT